MEDIFRSLSESVSEDCFNDIMGIVEEVINEVSVGMWKRAAINSLANRGYKAGTANANYEHKVNHDNSEMSDDELEASNNALGHELRMKHAEEVAKLPNSKRSANKVLKAADKVRDDRIAKKREREKKEIKKGNYAGAWDNPEANRSNHSNKLWHTNKWTNFLCN